ncbi:Crp/Fnr family transcriptional regulator [Nocardioides sp.]|uniref:Crp/Fnr family transcriptional regulator n=1 Tax=Nocardioides sp. TaxID=35761 RepID=UPI003D111D05
MEVGTGRRWPPGSLLSLLAPEHQAGLLGMGTGRSFDRNEILMREGEPGRALFLLLRGCVKVVSIAATGDVRLLAVRLAGDVVGELAALDGDPRSATVVTAARTTARVIGHEEFGRYVAAHAAVGAAVQRCVTAKLRQATRFRADAAAGPSTLARLARVLHQLGASYGQPSPSGLLIDVHLSQPELAALVGVAQASIERALGELRARGMVRTGYRQLLISDADGLRTLAAGEAG